MPNAPSQYTLYQLRNAFAQRRHIRYIINHSVYKYICLYIKLSHGPYYNITFSPKLKNRQLIICWVDNLILLQCSFYFFYQ